MDKLEFRTVNIRAFDLHTVIQPLDNQSMLQKGFQFLSDPLLYRFIYENKQHARSANLEIAPFEDQVFGTNHFWEFYTSIRHKGKQSKPDYWALQVPFTCKLLNTTIKIKPGNSNIEAKLWPQIFISALGWSTTINIRLRGNISVSQLIEFVGKLRGKATAGDSKIFDLNGEAVSLWKLYSAVQEKLFSDVYSTENPPGEIRNLDRYILISPERFSGPIKHFKGSSRSYPEMSKEERDSMLSILYGEPVDSENEANKFTKIEFHEYGPEFGLSEFRRGTFLFMQETAQVGTKHQRARRRLECFSSNVRIIAKMVMTLNHFYISNEARRYATTNAKIGSLLADVKINLTDLRDSYQHDFCKFLFANYAPLKNIG